MERFFKQQTLTDLAPGHCLQWSFFKQLTHRRRGSLLGENSSVTKISTVSKHSMLFILFVVVLNNHHRSSPVPPPPLCYTKNYNGAWGSTGDNGMRRQQRFDRDNKLPCVINWPIIARFSVFLLHNGGLQDIHIIFVLQNTIKIDLSRRSNEEPRKQVQSKLGAQI